jgi:hypothetical protein
VPLNFIGCIFTNQPIIMMKLLNLPLLLLIATCSFAQENSEKFKAEILRDDDVEKKDIKNEMITYDIAGLLTKTRHNAVLGFIGKEYERIRIKFISVIKNKDKPDQYFIYGKSMVKDNVCDFQGTLTITNAYAVKGSEFKDTKQGILIGTYSFFENPLQEHVGQFKGVFKTSWYINEKGQIEYDDRMMMDADGYSNNEFVGTWTIYSGKITKPCNWGDFRIPDSGDLDVGAAEFAPSDIDINNGWQSYRSAYLGDENTDARKKEESEWWK